MSELARKIEQSLETEEQRNRETEKRKNPAPDASRRYGAGAETEEPRAETVKERERREYEEFWKDSESKYWTPEQRKAYLEQGIEFLIDVHEKGVDTMVFMDKSARPLAGFFRTIWRRVWPDETPPAMRFMVPMHYSTRSKQYVLGVLLNSAAGSYVEEQDAQIFVKPRFTKKKPIVGYQYRASNTWSYRLRQVGKHETLDEKSVHGIDERIAKAENEEERERLRKIREAYLKLTNN